MKNWISIYPKNDIFIDHNWKSYIIWTISIPFCSKIGLPSILFLSIFWSCAFFFLFWYSGQHNFWSHGLRCRWKFFLFFFFFFFLVLSMNFRNLFKIYFSKGTKKINVNDFRFLCDIAKFVKTRSTKKECFCLGKKQEFVNNCATNSKLNWNKSLQKKKWPRTTQNVFLLVFSNIWNFNFLELH